MKRTIFAVPALVCALSLSSWGALALGQVAVRNMEQVQEQEQIYGSQLMTERERSEYHSRIRSAETNEEREQIRKEHHQVMQERAKGQGVALPDLPPPRGGMGGGGMGPGRGMGPGGGRGR